MAQGKGLFSTLGGYAKGMIYGMGGKELSMLSQSGQAGYNAGQLGRAAWQGMGSTGRGAVYGAAAGGAWGAVSDDTSVLGGMAMGAAGGAVGGRYGGSGMRWAQNYGEGGAQMAKGFGLGIASQVRKDARQITRGMSRNSKASTKLLANQAIMPFGQKPVAGERLAFTAKEKAKVAKARARDSGGNEGYQRWLKKNANP